MIIELAPFKIIEGISETSLLEVSNALQNEFLSQQPGFIKHELLRSGENEWLDLVHWSDYEIASKAMQMAMESPVCLRYFEMMVTDGNNSLTNAVKHYERITQY